MKNFPIIFLALLLWAVVSTVGFVSAVSKLTQQKTLLALWKDGFVWCDTVNVLKGAIKDGRSCYLPSRVYTFESPINIPSNVKLEGVGVIK